ncbi:MAG: UvrD-helicase domain-containing protein [Kiritimatiellae bacterium]|nr:UvrD-helicase domain-containing protein [Kiritimatiellia bacterium]
MYLAKIRSYFDSLGSLSKDERYAVWDAVNTMEQGNMASLGLHDEPLQGKGKGFRSCRANQDVRLIYVPFGEEGVLCYAGHHENAYDWAERHKCVKNPTTHVVQVYETVATQPAQPVAATVAFPPAGDRPNPFLAWPSDADLKTLGVPDDQLAFVRGIKNEDDLADKGAAGVMPDNIWSILVDLIDEPSKLPDLLATAKATASALGANATLSQQAAVNANANGPFSFLSGDELLNRMRAGALDAWRVFLHPEQLSVVNRNFNGPVKVIGGAGTGKTVVAIHRVKWLLENSFADSEGKILLTTFTNTLAGDLKRFLSAICTDDQMVRVDVQTLDKTAQELLRASGVKARIEYEKEGDISRKYMTPSMSAAGYVGKRKVSFFLDEYEQVVEADGIQTEDAYLAANRSGRSVPLSAEEREQLWPVFVKFRELFANSGLIRRGEAFNKATALLLAGAESPYAAVVVDEVQDLDAPALRLVAALSGNSATVAKPNSLVLVGDAHQRIYGRRVSLAACGIQTKGRSKTLKMNYRCTQKIRLRAESILAGVPVDDLDGGSTSLRGGRSLVLGQAPDETRFENEADMAKGIETMVKAWMDADNANAEDGCKKTYSDYAILLPTNGEVDKMIQSLSNTWLPAEKVVGEGNATTGEPAVRVMTFHRAKGLEFSGVVIVASQGKWPRKPTGFDSLAAPEKEMLLAREKSLLYVGMTRAISHVLLTGLGVAPAELQTHVDTGKPTDNQS